MVNADTRYINVTRLETVALKVGDKTVNWTFDTLGTNSFPLSKVVRRGDKVTVYLEESPPLPQRLLIARLPRNQGG